MHRVPISGFGKIWSKFAVLAITPLLITAASQGQTIPNPSFEANNFEVWPGFIIDNTPITGWTSNFDSGVGLNPAGGSSQFADNGEIPDGNNVAFITVGSTLSTTISGLTSGTTYTVTFRANAMSAQVPVARVSIDDQEELGVAVYSVGETRPYAYLAFEFEAAAASQTLTVFNDTAADDTLLVDDFSIAPSEGKWSVDAWTGDADSGVEASYVYTHAYNFGSASSPVINGVEFTGVAGANPAVTNEFSTVLFPNTFAGDVNTVTGNSSALATDFVYSGADVVAGTYQSINILGLTPGTEYVATVYTVAFDAPTPAIRWATFSVGEDHLTVNQDQLGNDSGLRISYRYIADANGSATFNIAPVNPVNVSIHVYGFSNRENVNRDLAPSISVEPFDATVAQGLPVDMTVAATGFPSPTFQWRLNGENIAGATSATYSIAQASAQNAGLYDVVVSNSLGSVTSRAARLTVGVPMNNPSFEADAFASWPGYSGENPGDANTPPGPNTPITGWTESDLAGSGINPIANGSSPFADNGIIPHGKQAAFIQSLGMDGSIAQTVSGLAANAQYYLHYYENARTGAGVPSIEVQLNGATIVPTHPVAPVGGGNLYREVYSDVFTAAGTSAELVFIKSGPEGADTTALLDNVAIVPVEPGTAPRIVSNPQPLLMSAGSSATFSARFIGSLPATYQWLKDGSPIAGATSATLTLNNVQSSDEANYALRITNSAGEATSAVARLTVAVPGVFGTGLDANGELLAAGEIDPHYTITTSPDVDFPGPDAAVLNDAWPVQAGVWVVHGPDSKWIAPQADQAVGNAPGDYVYRTTFDLTGYDPTRIQLVGAWAVDNAGTDILVNGTSTGITSGGFSSLTPFTITSGLVAGMNTVDFLVNNAPTAATPEAPNPSGLRVDLRAIAVTQSSEVELQIARSGTELSISWAPAAAGSTLESAPSVTGPWTEVANASNPYTATATGTAMFFRVTQ